jgi:large subunit ribosomal protein L31e
MGRVRDGKKKEMQPVTRDYTLNLHKMLHGIQFKKRAPRTIRDIKRFAHKEMYTQVWSQLVFQFAYLLNRM